MAQFKYKARNAEGRVLEGQIDAESEDQARAVLRGRKFTVLEISALKKGGFFGGGPKVKSKDIVIFSRQLATMVSAGLPLPQAIGIIAEQSDSKALRTVLLQVRDDISSGSNFPEALEKHPSVFSSLYVNMCKAGDTGGNLDVILERLSLFLEKSEALKAKIQAAMMYPIAIGVVAVGVVVFLMVKVIPSFKSVFTSFGRELPTPTKILIATSEFMQSQWYLMLGTVAAMIGVLAVARRTDAGARALDAMALKLPVVGDLMRKIVVSRFARTLGTLQGSGVPILSGLEIVAKTAGNKIIEEAILTARNKIREGEQIVTPLRATGVFPPMVLQMISAGEETGRLEAMLVKIADFYDAEVDTAVEGMMKLIEPMMVVFMGGTVGIIVLGMFMPMFEMSTLAGS
jgi:type IV pilus assembly protein PilC